MSLKTKVMINSVDVSSYVFSYRKEGAFGYEAGRLDLALTRKVKSLIDPQMRQLIEVWKGYTTSTDEKIFKGYIEDIDEEIGIIKIMAYDMLGALVRREVTYSYDKNNDASAGKISEIQKDLIETHGGLTAEVQDSGTTILVNKFICNHTDVLERCQRLAEVLNWQLYYNAVNDTVHFEEKGYNSNTTILTVGDNILGIPKWKNEGTEIITDLSVLGSVVQVETTKLFSGDGTNDTFTLDFTPQSVKVYEEVAATWVLRTGGKEHATSSDYDYAVDKENKQIVFESGSIPANAVDNVKIEFTYNIPTPVITGDSEAAENLQKSQKTLFKLDIENIDDAERYAEGILQEYKTPFKGTTLLVKGVSDLKVGYRIRVIDKKAGHNIDDWFVINKHIINYPSGHETIEVGDKAFRTGEWQTNVEEKIHKLQEENSKNKDLLLHVVKIGVDFAAPRGKLELKKRAIGSTFQLAASGTLSGIHPNSQLAGGAFGTAGGKLADTGDASDEFTQYIKQNDAYSLSFDGSSDDTITVSDDVSFDSTTISASLWIKGDTQITGQNIYVFSKWKEWAIKVSGATNNHNLSFYIHNGTVFYATGVDVLDNSWHHIVITQETGSLMFYIDGSKVGSTEVSNAIILDTEDIQIGSYSTTYGNFTGSIKEVKLFNRVLTAEEISRDYNSGKGIYGLGSEDGLVAAYHFEEGTGTSLADYSTNTNTGTITGATWVKDTDDIANAWTNDLALEFDGVNDYIVSSDIDYGTGNKISVCAWVKYTEVPGTEGYSCVVVKSTHLGDSPYSLYVRTLGRAGFAVQGSYAEFDGDYNDGKWHHMVGVLDDTTSYFYVDGVLKDTETGVSPLNNDKTVCIGSHEDASTYRPFEGLIKDIRVYSSSLSADQVSQIYNNGAGTIEGSRENLVLHFRLCEGSGTYIQDYSRNANVGTISSNPRWVTSTKAIE